MRAVQAVLVAWAACGLVEAEIPKSEYDKYVKEATDSTWREVEKQPLAMVEFFAPWCGACKAMQPFYDKAAFLLSEENTASPVPLYKLNGDANPVAHGKAGITGYPTLKIFRFGVMSDYSGSTSRVEGLSEKIAEYMQSQVGLSSKELTTTEALQKKIKKKHLRGEVAVVGYFTSLEKADFKIFLQVADQMRDLEEVMFYHVNEPKVLEDVGYYSAAGAVSVYRPWGGKQFKAAYKGSIFRQALEEFVTKAALPPVGYASETFMRLYKNRKLPILRVIVHPDKREDAMDGIQERLNPVAKKHADKVLVVVNEETTDYGHDAEDLRNGIYVIEDGKKKYTYDGEEHGEIADFVEKFLKKELTVSLKSAKAEGDAPPGEVQVVVGKTFNKYVMDKTKDVLLESYAPWCGHCKRLEPTYKQLALKFKSNPQIVIAKIDQTANEVPVAAYKAGSFPTIHFAATDGKEAPVKYTGERDLESLAQWVRDKATVPLVEDGDDEEL